MCVLCSSSLVSWELLQHPAQQSDRQQAASCWLGRSKVLEHAAKNGPSDLPSGFVCLCVQPKRTGIGKEMLFYCEGD